MKNKAISIISKVGIVVILIAVLLVAYFVLTQVGTQVSSATTARLNTTSVISESTPSSSGNGGLSITSPSSSFLVTSSASHVSSSQSSVLSSTLIYSSTTSTRTATSASVPARITIENFTFVPKIAKVIIGLNNTVIWTNEDAATHTVTSSTGLFNSGNLDTGSTFSFTFSAPGNYSYYCALHLGMTGTIMVQSIPEN